MKAYQTISEKSMSLEEIPNLLPVTKNEQGKCLSYPGSWLNGGEENIGKVSAIKEDKAKK